MWGAGVGHVGRPVGHVFAIARRISRIAAGGSIRKRIRRCRILVPDIAVRVVVEPAGKTDEVGARSGSGSDEHHPQERGGPADHQVPLRQRRAVGSRTSSCSVIALEVS
jgi:hypothetical protein